MKRLVIAMAALALMGAFAATPASASFGLSNIELSFAESDGSPATEAGTHPYEMTTSFDVNEVEGKELVNGAIRNLDVFLPEGFVGSPTAVPRCETIDFLTFNGGRAGCADGTAVGFLTVLLGGGLEITEKETVPIYNLRPSPGVAAKLGFVISQVPVTINAGINPDPPYNVIASLSNTSQVLEVFSADTTLWGNPADPKHDPDRGVCAYTFISGSCSADIPAKPFLALPRSCTGPLETTFKATSWWSGEPLTPEPPATFEGTAETPPGLGNCEALGFAPRMTAKPTSESAESASGLALDFDVEDEGLTSPTGTAHSDIADSVLALPQGMTLNPSAAEGLATCSPSDLARETPDSPPGAGCPQASKVGTIEAETPILEGTVLKGALYVATQDDPATPRPGAENPFDSLLALYIVVKDAGLGVIVKLPAKIEPDPRTGQLVTVVNDIPQVPLSHVRFRLREGGRSPLITPPSCGSYTVVATLTPSGDPSAPLAVPSDFQIARGVDGGPCPPGGPPPFVPGFEAGTLNNNAASYSPFYLRLTRRDGDQDLTRFDANLPPGLLAKLAGVAKCPDASIAAAKAKTGRAELASPSCPAASAIGRVIGGAGVGSELTYVSGKLYLAGPFGGAPLSVVGIVPAVAGPFDVGTVVVRQGLDVNPKTAVGEIDGSRSDPIPHILAGIPLRVRDIRVFADRPDFTLNPTDCDPFATHARIWGGGGNPFSSADDAPVSRSPRFQAANCARLGFKPRVSLSLKGGTERGGHPALKGVYRPRRGDANVSELIARLPHSAFLDQGHIRTICTRVQFAASACPAAAVYGHVTAATPLLEEPLKGPVYLRSSSHKLPDLVLALHGLVDVEVSARLDSIKGGIRASFENTPDAPLSKVVLRMRGGPKGLIVNSRNLCARTQRANLELSAHSGKSLGLHPQLKSAGCHGVSRGRHRSR